MSRIRKLRLATACWIPDVHGPNCVDRRDATPTETSAFRRLTTGSPMAGGVCCISCPSRQIAQPKAIAPARAFVAAPSLGGRTARIFSSFDHVSRQRSPAAHQCRPDASEPQTWRERADDAIFSRERLPSGVPQTPHPGTSPQPKDINASVVNLPYPHPALHRRKRRSIRRGRMGGRVV